MQAPHPSSMPYRIDTPTRAAYMRDPVALLDELHALAARYPAEARVLQAGTSVEGRPVAALVLGRHVDDPAVPRVLVAAGVHGRETANTPLVVDWARDLLDRAASGDAARGALLDARTVILVPQASPDTAARVARGLDTGMRDDIWRRTNLATDGVDLNRNFPGPTWGAGSASPGSPNYRGAAAGSEPETRAVVDLATAWQPDAVYDVHSPGGVVLAPAGAGAGGAADARAAAGLVARASGYAVTTSGEHWDHAVGGTLKDWAHDVLGVPALTIETGAVHHQNDILFADTRARIFPTLDALVATVDGRHVPPPAAAELAKPPAAGRFVPTEHLQGVQVRRDNMSLITM